MATTASAWSRPGAWQASPIPGVDVLDGGTLGLMLMPYIAGRLAVLVLDAVSEAHGAPGDVVVIGDSDVRRGHGVRATAHDIGLVDALSAAELAGCAPARIALVGIVPASRSPSIGASAPWPAAGWGRWWTRPARSWPGGASR